MVSESGRAFSEWLRAQLKIKKMSQRQLAHQSGVDHSTISRLIRGERVPSLGTATMLARGLRELGDEADTPQYLRLVSAGAINPTMRVEYALRGDDWLGEPEIREVMLYYLAVRMRRPPEAGWSSENGEGSLLGGSIHSRPIPLGRTVRGPATRPGRSGTRGTD